MAQKTYTGNRSRTHWGSGTTPKGDTFPVTYREVGKPVSGRSMGFGMPAPQFAPNFKMPAGHALNLMKLAADIAWRTPYVDRPLFRPDLNPNVHFPASGMNWTGNNCNTGNYDGWHGSVLNATCQSIWTKVAYEATKQLTPAQFYWTTQFLEDLGANWRVHAAERWASDGSGNPYKLAWIQYPAKQAHPIELALDPFKMPIRQPAPEVLPLPPGMPRPADPRPQASTRTYGPRMRPPTRTATGTRYVPRPPKSGEKERKWQAGPAAAAALLDLMTEGLDALEAIWLALPARYRTDPSAYGMVNDLLKSWDKVDPKRAAQNLAYNHVEDAIAGRILGAMAKANRGAGLSGVGSASGHGYTPRPW